MYPSVAIAGSTSGYLIQRTPAPARIAATCCSDIGSRQQLPHSKVRPHHTTRQSTPCDRGLALALLEPGYQGLPFVSVPASGYDWVSQALPCQGAQQHSLQGSWQRRWRSMWHCCWATSTAAATIFHTIPASRRRARLWLRAWLAEADAGQEEVQQGLQGGAFKTKQQR